MNDPSHLQFWRRVLSSYQAHALAALSRRQGITHSGATFKSPAIGQPSLGWQCNTATELAQVPTVCGSLQEAIDSLKADHDFLLKGQVFSKDQIESYLDLKQEDRTATG